MSVTASKEGVRGEEPTGTLYVCGTPIGNLEDISYRALRILREVQCIAAEDTRHTRKLLTAFEIKTPLLSLHEHNEAQRTPELVERLQAGESIALVSDAGMPGISDPGAKLIAACVEAGVRVEPIPGPTALVAALVGSGLPCDRFAFEGFLPRQAAQRRRHLEALEEDERTLIFYEAPHRLRSTLKDMHAIWGERRAVLARELTKVHEEFVRGSLSELVTWCEEHPPRGEFVIVVEGGRKRESAPQVSEDTLRAKLSELMEEGSSLRDAVRAVSEELQLPRGKVYAEALRLKE